MKCPLKYILKQFNEKPLSTWRSTLERWKQVALSNQCAPEILDEVTEIHEFVVRLIEIASVLEYQPDFNWYDYDRTN